MFQLRLDTATLARVRARFAALVSDAEDVVHIYPACSSCADRADILGAAIALDDLGLCRGVWRGAIHPESGSCTVQTEIPHFQSVLVQHRRHCRVKLI